MSTIKNIAIVGAASEHCVRAHLPDLLQSQEVNVTHFFDPRLVLIGESRTGESWNVVYQDPEQDGGRGISNIGNLSHNSLPMMVGNEQDIYDNPSIDAVMIMSADRFHSDQILKSIKAGKHVFAEKPLAIDSEGMQKVTEAFELAKEKNLVISSCHPRRFDPPIIKLTDLLSNGPGKHIDLGRITRFDFDFFYHKPEDEWKKGRSLMLDHLGHEIDSLRFIVGHNNEDIAMWKMYDSHDKYYVQGTLGINSLNEKGKPNNRIRFNFKGERKLDSHQYLERLYIEGVNGCVHLDINTGHLCVRESGESFEMHLPAKDYGEMFSPVNSNFIDSLTAQEKPYLDKEQMVMNNSAGIVLLETGRFVSS